MKNKIALATAALVAGSSLATAEIVINDFLSFEGFIDMSYTYTDIEEGGEDAGNSSSYQIDQVEISWLFDFDPVTAQIDLQYEDLPGDTTAVEQAFATYDLGNGGAITAGRYASMIGFEAFEPTGLYQYSFAYDMELGYNDDGDTDFTVIPGYSQGVKYTYETDTTFFGISLQDSAFDSGDDALRGGEDADYGVEVAGSIAFENGLSWFVGGAYEDSDEADSDAYMLNTYVTFETGAWIFAGELNYGNFEGGQALTSALEEVFYDDVESLLDDALDDYDFGSLAAGEEDVFQAMIMANFAYSEQASVTGRISYTDHESDVSLTDDGDAISSDVEADFFKYTLAHGYAFTDNLFLVTELSYVDGEIDTAVGDIDFEALEAAVELIFSF